MDSLKAPKKRSSMGVPMRSRRATVVKPVDTLEIEDITINDHQADSTPAPEVIDLPQSPIKPTRKQKRAERKTKRLAKKGWRRHISWRRAAAAIGLIFLLIGGFFAVKLYLAARNVFGNSAGVAAALTGDLTKLKGEGDGRVNIVLLGVGGEGHDGGTLSDTIIVASLDVKTKEVAMVGIPRDLYVPIKGYGSDKINTAHAYGEKYKYKGGGGQLAKDTLENVLGVDIHYYARIDFEGFRKAIDVVGGIDITNKETLVDTSYPCDNNQWRACGYRLNPGTYHMSGLQALKYARCRKGTCGDDYGRAARQQEVLVALRKKALSLGTLSNPAKIAGLIDAVGTGFKTDLSLNEIKKLVSLGKDIDTSKIVNKVLTNNPTDGSTPLVQNGNIGGASVVIPTAGVGNFSAIRLFMRQIFADSYIRSEKARIEVQNGTTRAGLATSTATLLKSYGYNVIGAVSADKTTYTKTVIYDYSGGSKPITLKYLENRFKVKSQKMTAPTPTSNTSTASTPEIRIIIGADYQPEDD